VSVYDQYHPTMEPEISKSSPMDSSRNLGVVRITNQDHHLSKSQSQSQPLHPPSLSIGLEDQHVDDDNDPTSYSTVVSLVYEVDTFIRLLNHQYPSRVNRNSTVITNQSSPSHHIGVVQQQNPTPMVIQRMILFPDPYHPIGDENQHQSSSRNSRNMMMSKHLDSTSPQQHQGMWCSWF
jgi:hypothetical protein